MRRLEMSDLDAALAIQSEAYPAFLVEAADAFASRIALPEAYCLAATRGGVLVAYLLAHKWKRQDPPLLGAVLTVQPDGDILFIHDLAASSTERGSGVGRELVARAFEMAARDGLDAAELIAVEGAARYWRRLGFMEGRLPKELSSYGPGARWMTCPIPPP